MLMTLTCWAREDDKDFPDLNDNDEGDDIGYSFMVILFPIDFIFNNFIFLLI